jgi:TRAP-type C4-dicarboxylate transport system substrate-binding protein
MIETTKRVLAAVLVATLLGVLAAGCSLDGGADKAGGSSAPTVLRLAAAEDAEQPDSQRARYFASRVSELSDRSLRVRIVYDAGGEESASYESRLAGMVRKGKFELGWIGARAWDRSGIKSFQALQAPFLVTNHALLGRIATGPLAARMLTGLDGHGFVGLALVPDRLRYPIAAQHALASPDDFAGARVRVPASRATDALMRALGATPVHLRGEALSAALANGEIDGSEASLGTNSAEEGENFLTWNVIFFPKTVTLFAGRNAYERLGDDQREILSEAARQTAAYAAAHPLSESELMRNFCSGGRPVTAVAASREDLAALTRAAHPVYAELERDPRTRALIAAIRDLKATTPAGTPAQAPDGCAHEAPASRGRERPASLVNGTYRWRLTEEGARRVGAKPSDEDVGSVVTMTLRDGGWQLGDDEFYSGTYSIRGNRLIFDWPSAAGILTFTFRRDESGSLDIAPVLPMDRGDQFVWGSAPWRRVGPPVRAVP